MSGSVPLQRISTLVLIGALLAAVAIIETMHRGSREGIDRQLRAVAWEALARALPQSMRGLAAKPLEPLPGVRRNVVEAFGVYDDGRLAAVVARASATGCYVDTMSFAVAFDPTGRVLGTVVLAHAETPGLGAEVADPATGWLGQFDGLASTSVTEPDWALAADDGRFDAVSGATTTSACMLDGIGDTLRWFESARSSLDGGG